MSKSACFVFCKSLKNDLSEDDINNFQNIIKKESEYALKEFGVDTFFCSIDSLADLCIAKSVYELKKVYSFIKLICITKKNNQLNSDLNKDLKSLLMKSDKKVLVSDDTSQIEIKKMLTLASDLTLYICDNNVVESNGYETKSKIDKKVYFIQNQKGAV